MTVTVGIILASLRGRPRLFFGDATVSNAGFGGLDTNLPLLVIRICFFGVVFVGSFATESAAMLRSALGNVSGFTACSK
jgi:hypothetical protein